ncbi:MAG: alpha/beta fold hydrolase, partial [Beijerinckiaceae bacterium]
ARELTTMRVHSVSEAESGPAAILVAPFALHTATTSDFAPSHSVVESLLANGIQRLVVTDWRSADAGMRYLSIDSYLADLNVLVDDFGPPVQLVGLCQGGWLAAAYAARFPHKVSRLVLVGAPLDMAAAPSALSGIARQTPHAAVAQLLAANDGLLPGELMMALWPTARPSKTDIERTLQTARLPADLVLRFEQWLHDLVDLPGVFYQQTLRWIFIENRLSEGHFPALGQPVGLADITCPVFLLAASEDEIVSPPQLLAAAEKLGTPKRKIIKRLTKGRHLTLFMGAKILRQDWPQIARFLTGHAAAPHAPAAGCSGARS